jgi:hypothetical protein
MIVRIQLFDPHGNVKFFQINARSFGFVMPTEASAFSHRIGHGKQRASAEFQSTTQLVGDEYEQNDWTDRIVIDYAGGGSLINPTITESPGMTVAGCWYSPLSTGGSSNLGACHVCQGNVEQTTSITIPNISSAITTPIAMCETTYSTLFGGSDSGYVWPVLLLGFLQPTSQIANGSALATQAATFATISEGVPTSLGITYSCSSSNPFVTCPSNLGWVYLDTEDQLMANTSVSLALTNSTTSTQTTTVYLTSSYTDSSGQPRTAVASASVTVSP